MNGFVNVFFASDLAWNPPSSVRITMAEFAHDVVTITVPLDNPDAKRYASGRPVSMQWWNKVTRKQSWVGYINHIEPSYTGTSKPEIKVYCIGATASMRAQNSRTFKTRTIPSIVTEICMRNRFLLTTDPHTTVWPSTLQHAESDWHFLARMAEKIGYSLCSAGTTIFFRKRTTSLKRSGESIPILSPALDTLDFLRPAVGAGAPQGGDLAVREMYGVDPRRNKSIYGKSNPASKAFGTTSLTPVFNRVQQGVALTPSEIMLTAAAQIENNRLVIQANAQAPGDVRVRPGSLVFVRDVSATDWGYWYVQSVVHDFVGHRHTMSMTLGRDSIGSGRATDPPVVPSKTAVSSRLINGKWVA